MNAAGAAAHRCGWSLNRTDSTASNAQPSAKPSSTTPVRTFSFAGMNGAATRTSGGNQSSRHRSSDDQPDASPTHGLQASGFLEGATVLIRPSHGGLNSMKVDTVASLWPASVPA